MKAKIDKLGNNKLLNAPNGLNNLKSYEDYLDADKLNTVTTALKKLNDVVSKEVVTNTKFNKLNAKVNNLENKILMHLT